MKIYEVKFEWTHYLSDHEIYSAGFFRSKKRAKKRISKLRKKHKFNKSLRTYIFKHRVK